MENTHDYLIDMLVPSLDSPEYANQLDTAFQNIKTNFSILANTDFIKGETGDSSSMQIEPVVFDPNYSGKRYISEYGFNLLKAIHPNGVRTISSNPTFPIPIDELAFQSNDLYAPVTVTYKVTENNNGVVTETNKKIEYNWYSQFSDFDKEANFGAGNLYVIAKRNGNDSTDNYTPYSSLYYTFLDWRFYNEHVGEIDPETFKDLKDMSCVLVLTPTATGGYTFTKYDAFPTMYYEDNVGLCWKINGAKTGLPVRGIPGEDGKNAVLHIVKAAETEEEDKCKITEIFDNGFKQLNDTNTIKSLNGQSAIVFVPTTTKNNFYFSKMYLDDSSDDESKWYLYAYCKEENALNTQIAYNDFINVLKAINLYKSDTEAVTTLKGLFIPIQFIETDEESSEESGESTKQAVHLMTAVNNFDAGEPMADKPNLLFTAIDDINTTSEDAYKMYIDTYMYLEYDKTLIATDSTEDEEYKYIDGWGTPASHVLKYKLSKFITSVDAIDTLDNASTFPEELTNAIKTTGIYQWVLDTTISSYDVEELNSGNQDNTGSYPFNNEFGPVYTMASTPSIDSDFYWYCQYKNYENDDKAGWTKKKFIFKKLVPICINNNAYSKDTALNINYNVNVLGDDKSNGSHNLTVHGNISSDSANVYGSLIAKDYKNIYTSTVIKGDEGIELGKVIDDANNTSPAFVVDSSGNVTKSSSINSNDVTAETVTVENGVVANNVSCNTFKLAHADTVGMTAEIVSMDANGNNQNNYLNNTSNISINNTNAIKISRGTNIDDIPLTELNDKITSDIIPHINSDVPMILNNNANIVVTNATDVNDVYVNFSNTGDMPLNFRYVDVNNKKKTIDFNSAKDYNLYKVTQKSDSVTSQFKSEYTGSVSSKSISKSSSSWKDDMAAVTNENEDIKSWSIAQFKINKSNSSDVLVNNIKFSLSEYLLKITVNGRCHYGSWPIMTNDSKIEMRYYYSTSSSSTPTLLYTDSTTYKFSNTNTGWYGINHVEKEYGGKDRYYIYKFAPKTFTCYSSSNTFKTLRTEFERLNKGGVITIYAVPVINVKVKSENSWNNIKGVTVNAFNYNSTTSKTESSTINRTTLKSFPSATKHVNAFCEYHISTTSNDNQHKSTTICDNGIVFTSGKYVFGLGYAEHIYNHKKNNNNSYTTNGSDKIWGTRGFTTPGSNESIDGSPVLFFVNSEASGVKEWISKINTAFKGPSTVSYKKTINFNYNRAINTIPLEDIFYAIKHLRTTDDNSWKKFGL